MEDIVITGWADLCEKLYENSWQETLGRFRTDYAFRGVSNKNYKLKNRFQRTCGHASHLEYHLMRNFKKYAVDVKPESMDTDWKLLTMGQHYGLPTRLIDWTYSPFVAIHFATSELDRFDVDGVIWKVDFVKVNNLLPNKIKNVLKKVGSNSFTIEMLEETIPNIDHFDSMTNDNLTLFFEPPSIDMRIVNQFALFSVMSHPTLSMDDWLSKHPEVYRRLIIPKELKLEIRDKLDQANITERTLFPGLDGLANWLDRHYRPKDLIPSKNGKS